MKIITLSLFAVATLLTSCISPNIYIVTPDEIPDEVVEGIKKARATK